jgi:hypothetical protein
MLVHCHALSPPTYKFLSIVMMMCIILSVCECTLLVSLEAFMMTEVSETFLGNQPLLGVKQRTFTPCCDCLPQKISFYMPLAVS